MDNRVKQDEAYLVGYYAGINVVVNEVKQLWKPMHHNLCYGVIDPHPDCILCKWLTKLMEWKVI